jgi:uncharacterized protein (TIGR02246 family)
MKFPLLPISALLFAAGCAAPPPPDTRAADIQAVKDVEAAWSKDAATRDVEKFVSYYADDASILMPNMPAITGNQAIRADIQHMMADPNYSLTFKADRAEAAKGGDMVYTQGTYRATSTDSKTGKSVTDTGKNIAIYRKQADGSWKCVVDMVNSDLPLGH